MHLFCGITSALISRVPRTTSASLSNVVLTVGMASVVIPGHAAQTEPRPVDGIMDNSFLIEEAFNQDAGVVQNIVTGAYGVNRMSGGDVKIWDLSFTQEWPFPNQSHQVSYTVPWSFQNKGGRQIDGVRDVLINYRYQAWFDEKSLTAFSPRLSLVLPTGDSRQGLGDDTLGYQVNLPFSTTLDGRWYFHVNVGCTWLPNAGPGLRQDLLDSMVGASFIYAATPRLHFMLEGTSTWEDQGTGGHGHVLLSVLSPGVRLAVNLPGDRQIVLGLAVPFGLSKAAPEYGLFLYASFERPFAKIPASPHECK